MFKRSYGFEPRWAHCQGNGWLTIPFFLFVPSGLGGERVSCEEIHSLLFPCINYCDFENPHKYWKYLLTGWVIWCIYVKGVLNKELRTQTVGFWFTHHGG